MTCFWKGQKEMNHEKAIEIDLSLQKEISINNPRSAICMAKHRYKCVLWKSKGLKTDLYNYLEPAPGVVWDLIDLVVHSLLTIWVMRNWKEEVILLVEKIPTPGRSQTHKLCIMSRALYHRVATGAPPWPQLFIFFFIACCNLLEFLWTCSHFEATPVKARNLSEADNSDKRLEHFN